MAISTQLKQRLIMGLTGVFLLFSSIYYSYHPIFQIIFVLLNAAIIGGTLREYYQLTKHKGYSPLDSIGITCSVLYVISIYVAQLNPTWYALPTFILFLSLLLFFFSFFNKQSDPLINIAITLFGLAYLTIPLSFGLKINFFNFGHTYEDGRIWFAYAFVVTKMTDTGAYFFGKTFGKHKLIPHISPKKTVEGAIGGTIAAIISSLLFYFYFREDNGPQLFTISAWQSVWMAFAISLLAQFGDLAESILKRDAGVKDSSHLPGLGGLLDIADSLIFTLPFVYFILRMKFVN